MCSKLVSILLLAAATLAASAKMTTTYYDIFGVKKGNFSPGELKKSYRKLSLDYHPDRIPASASAAVKAEAEAMFVVIAHGYDVLSDEEKTKRYDELVKHGIYEYIGDDAYEEWNARRNGWRSDHEIYVIEGRVIMCVVVVIIGIVGWVGYQKYMENEAAIAKAKSRKKANLDTIAKAKAQLQSTTNDKSKKAVSASQQQQKELVYTKALQSYQKELKKTLRTLLKGHDFWFAPTFSDDAISTLCVNLSPEELTCYTKQLCHMLDHDIPTAPMRPTSATEEANLTNFSDGELSKKVSGREILRRLAAREAEFSVKSASKSE